MFKAYNFYPKEGRVVKECSPWGSTTVVYLPQTEEGKAIIESALLAGADEKEFTATNVMAQVFGSSSGGRLMIANDKIPWREAKLLERDEEFEEFFLNHIDEEEEMIKEILSSQS